MLTEEQRSKLLTIKSHAKEIEKVTSNVGLRVYCQAIILLVDQILNEG